MAKEYVEAMWLMLQQDKPDDYVIATNETHTVKEFLEETFACLDLDWNEYVGFDKKYERPAEVDLLIGNPEKAKKQLGWEPKTTFKGLVELMVEEDMKLAQRERLWQKRIFPEPMPRIFVSGHRGMVGSALVRALKQSSENELILASRDELDLLNQSSVEQFIQEQKPDIIINAAAKVGNSCQQYLPG